jgi:hypothetical protein
VDRRIDLSNLDLDAAAVAMASRVEQWRSAGLTVGEMTWMDNDAAWPRRLEPRESVTRPMSVGIQLHRPDGAEAEVVLYAGGWADFAVFVPGQETTCS